MRLFEAWRDNRSQRVQERQVRRLVGEQLRQVAEVVTSQVTADLMAEDQGWSKVGTQATTYDLTAVDLQKARTACLWLWGVDPIVSQRVMLLQSGTFGQGVTTPRATDRRVQEVLDRLWEDEDNQLALFSREAQVVTNLLLMLEGERFFTLHTSQTESIIKLATLFPSEIAGCVTHPQNSRKPVLWERRFKPQVYDFSSKSWKTDTQEQTWYYRDHRCSVEALALLREDGHADEDAEALIAGAPNVQPDVVLYQVKTLAPGLRGRPEVYRAYDWTRSHANALSDLATITKALAAFVWKKKVKANTQAAMNKAALMLQTPVPGAAAVQVENQNVNLEAVNVQTGHATNQQVTIREMFLQAIRDGGFGEHWYGNADTGNLATASAMELPAIWRVEDRQQLFREVFMVPCDLAIERAATLQDFPMTRKLPKRVDRTYDVDFPPAQPLSQGEAPMRIQAVAAVADAGYLPKREASYQIMVALGSNNVTEQLDELYPAQEKMEEDDSAQVVEEPPVETPTVPPPVETPPSVQVTEAVRPFP